jgi:hypothetical protein
MRVNVAHEYSQCPNMRLCGFGLVLTGLAKEPPR